MAKQHLALFCIFILFSSILSSASATAETSLDKIQQYQQQIEEAAKKAEAKESSTTSQEQQIPAQPNNRYDPPKKQPPKPAHSESEEPTPLPGEAISTPPKEPPARTKLPKQNCDPRLPARTCKPNQEEADSILQKILAWKKERDTKETPTEEPQEPPSPTTSEFHYDQNGNLIEDERYHYTYNTFNQLESITDKRTALLTEHYDYDQQGNRIKKTSYNDEKTKTTYYLDNYEYTIDSDGNTLEQTKIHHESQLIAIKQNDKTKYHHPDHLGSTDIITNQDGEITEEIQYEPYGMPTQAVKSSYLYTGKELDNTFLQYYGARYYNPLHARFTQPDTIIADIYNPQNLNRYSYVLNNPYKYTDPTGNFWIAAIGVAFTIAAILLPYYTAYNAQETINSIDQASNDPTPENIALAGLAIYDAATPIPEGKIVKEAGKWATRKIGRSTTRRATKEYVEKALSNTKGLEHGYNKHAKQLDLGFTGHWRKDRNRWIELNRNVIQNNEKTFKHKLGKYQVTGFYKNVDGQDIVSFVYDEGPSKGGIASTWKASEDQIEKWWLK